MTNRESSVALLAVAPSKRAKISAETFFGYKVDDGGRFGFDSVENGEHPPQIFGFGAGHQADTST